MITMNESYKNADIVVGNTPVVRLRAIEKEYGLSAALYAKDESKNEGGSIKDRVALAIIDDAEKKGKLRRGGVIVEATSGNTGVGLALIGNARGYKTVIVMPDSMSVERRELIKRYGGEIVLTDGKKGMQGAVAEALRMVGNTPNCVLADQFNNPACVAAHYQTTAPEIWTQTGGRVDVFVAAVGTGGTLTGTGRFLKQRNPDIRVVAVEPRTSPLLSQGVAGAHAIQGIGANFVPSVLDRSVYDEVLTVTDEAAFATAKLLRRAEGLFVGISSGANVAAAIELARREENRDKNIVTILPDDGGRYASIPEFAD